MAKLSLSQGATAEVETGETTILVRACGSGPPLLLLHGFPETHLMWRGVAPLLARDFTVVCADLRGYGRSGCPVSATDHAPYAKRAMANDMVTVMQRLGFSRFSVAGHDRGGRVAYRMALDHADCIDRLAVLDIVPTGAVWDRADARFALAYWPWSLLAQPEPLPERILAAAPEAIIDDALGGWGSPSTVFPPEVRAAYLEALRDPTHAHAICEEYRAAATIDRDHDTGISRLGVASPVPSSCYGGPEERSILGTSKSLDPSRCGRRGPTMCEGVRCRLATSFQRKRRSRPPRRWSDSSTAQGGANAPRLRELLSGAWPAPRPRRS